MEWHRIDDPENPAPKDGTKVLVSSAIPGAIVTIAQWIHPENREEWESNLASWWRVHCEREGRRSHGIKPTHWQPLPEPPRP